MGKVLEVSIKQVDNDGNITTIKVTGEDAKKWGETVDGWASYMYVRGQEFPKLNWETVNESV